MHSWRFTVSFDTFELAFPFSAEESETHKIVQLVEWITKQAVTSELDELICCMEIDETSSEDGEEFEIYTELEEALAGSPRIARGCQLFFFYLHDMGIIDEEKYTILIQHIWRYQPPAAVQ